MGTRHGADLLGLHGAAMMLGGTALFSKLVPLPALDITALRGLIAALALMVILLARGQRLRLGSRREYGVMLISGLLFAGHWLTYFWAMQVSSVAVGIIALFTFPLITALIEPLVDRRAPARLTLFTGALVALGVALMAGDGGLRGGVVPGIALGVGSALLFSARNVLQQRRLRATPGMVSMFYQSAIAGVVFLPFVGAASVQASWGAWGLLLLLGTVFTAVPHSLIVHGLRTISATNVSFILALQVFYAVTFAALVLGEHPGITTLAGGLLIVGASTYTTIQAQKQAAQPWTNSR